MHLCFCNPPGEYYSPVSGGAIATIVMEVSRQLIARGHRVSVVTACNGDPVYPVGMLEEVVFPSRADLKLPRRVLSSFARRIHGWDWPYYDHHRRAYRAAIHKLRPDAVIFFNDLVSPVWLRRELPRARIALWLQNEWNTRQRDLRPLIASTDTFLTCSEYIRRWTAVTHGIPFNRLTVAGSGVDLDTFTPRSTDLERSSSLRVLFLGRIDFNKGPDIAADAVMALRQEGGQVQLTVAGGLWWYGHGGEERDPFFRLLKGKMEAAQASYLGHVPRACVPELLRTHDVVCVLSRSREPFALVTLEAMASGCAVVASNRGGLPEACGGAATLVDPDDFDAVLQSLRALAQDPALLRRQKQRALERARRAPWRICADVVEKTLVTR